jgi:hypothetical protein
MARNVLVTALATLAIGAAALGTSAPALAGGPLPKVPVKMPFPKPFPKLGPAKPDPAGPSGPVGGYGHKHYGGAGLAFGLMGGLALAAAASASQEDCYIVRKRFVTEDGDLIVRRVRVCE